MVDKMSRYKYAPLLVFQIFLMVLYIVFTTYGGDKEVNVRALKFQLPENVPQIEFTTYEKILIINSMSHLVGL
ncbi:hypothetical protein B5X24_HaOG204574 [Helicoverpa armigera]|nr:hypothetical protein B5X24_HaOG204574 [Helicoverpa armigera]